MKRIIAATLAIAAMVGCDKDNEQITAPEERIAVEFTSTQIGTRAVGNAWEVDDQVGLFMCDAGDEIIFPYKNIAYKAATAATTSSFTAVDLTKKLYYPEADNTTVNIYAYYPYQTLDPFDNISIDITKQNGVDANGKTTFDQDAVDFMVGYVDDVVGAQDKNNDSGAIAFTFKRIMSKLTLEVTLDHNISVADYDDAKIKLDGIKTSADMDYKGILTPSNTESTISLKHEELTDAQKDGDNIKGFTVTAILLPCTEFDGDIPVEFEVGGYKFTTKIPKATQLFAGKNHTFNVTINDNKVEFGECTIGDWTEINREDIYVPKTSGQDIE